MGGKQSKPIWCNHRRRRHELEVMKRFRYHLLALGAAVIAVLSMLLLTTVSFAAPARSPTIAAMAGCHDAGSNTGSPACSNDCAIVCHAIVVQPVELSPNPSWTTATYVVTVPHSSPVSVEADDPPPRSNPA